MPIRDFHLSKRPSNSLPIRAPIGRNRHFRVIADCVVGGLIMSLTFRVSPMAILLIAFALAACATGVVSQKAPISSINSEKALALKGYDAVAYFTDQRPVSGSADFAYRWHNVDWRFARAEHLDTFTAHPAEYAPQYGGELAPPAFRGVPSPNSILGGGLARAQPSTSKQTRVGRHYD